MKRSEQLEENTWKTSDIFKSEEDFKKTLDQALSLSNELMAYDGKLNDATSLLSFMKGYEEVVCLLDDCIGYASLLSDQDTTNAHNQELKGLANSVAIEISTKLSFSDVQIMNIDHLEEYYGKEPILEKYRIYLEEVCRMKDHTLSQEEEKLIASSENMASSPYQIFGMLNNADLKFKDAIDSKGNAHTLTTGTYIHLLEQEDEVLRRSAYENFYAGYKSMIHTLAACLNGQTKQLKFYADARGYASSLECAVDSNNVPSSVYTQLIDSVHKKIHVLHKYMAVRKKVIKKEKLHMYDLYVPMVNECNVPVSFEQAKKDVLQSVQLYGSEYVNVYERGLNSRWIDVYENEGKRSGAYSSGQRVHPFVLMNYADSLNTEFTLAHEMGHAMHSYMSTKYQEPLDRHYKIFVAEVASTCNEALLISDLLKRTSDPVERKYLINYFLDQFKGTMYRQTMFAEFEMLTHDIVNQGGVLTAEQLCELYLTLNKKYFGEEMVSDSEIAYEWARIPHFYTPFYVYQYATGFAAAIAISSKILKGEEGIVEKYKQFLSSGSSMDPIDLLKLCDVDMSTPQPIEEALDVFEEYLSELEKSI